MINTSRATFAFLLTLLTIFPAWPQSESQNRHQPAKSDSVKVPRTTGPSVANDDQSITLTNGKIQITTPGGWKTARDLNDAADLQVEDGKGQLYLIVLTENKIDFSDMTLDKHSKTTLAELIRTLTSTTVSNPTSLKISGNQAVQYEVRGTIDGLNVVYLHTTVETSAHFHQIAAWALVSTYLQKKDVIQGIVRSFKEIES